MSHSVKMTSGNILKQLTDYAIPLILGNLFQLTYNVVDSVIVGRFIGKDTLAAVGCAAPVMNIFILGISGLCIGASIIMSQHFGADKQDSLKREMATVSVFGLWFSMITVLLGMLGTPLLLKFLHVPDRIFPITVLYLRLIFLGMPFTFFYNAVSSALKSIGDSRTPLLFLMLASVCNAVLDLIFIGGLHFGIICSALTTIIAQALSALLCIGYVYRKVPLLSITLKEFQIDRSLLKETLQYGSITALQQACQPVGNFLVQGAINRLGIDAMAAFAAVTKIDDYALVPERNISNAMTTFTAQNYGAHNKKRVRQGFFLGMGLEIFYGICICVTVLLLRRPLMLLFVSKEAEAVITEGTRYLTMMAFFYILPGLTNGMQGYFRGISKLKVTLAGTIIQTSFRVIFSFLLSVRMGICSFPAACAIGWTMMLVAEGIYFFIIHK